MSKVSQAMDEAVAWNLDAHVMGKMISHGYSRGVCLTESYSTDRWLQILDGELYAFPHVYGGNGS